VKSPVTIDAVLRANQPKELLFQIAVCGSRQVAT